VVRTRSEISANMVKLAELMFTQTLLYSRSVSGSEAIILRNHPVIRTTRVGLNDYYLQE
jgi:hypothetical protein